MYHYLHFTHEEIENALRLSDSRSCCMVEPGFKTDSKAALLAAIFYLYHFKEYYKIKNFVLKNYHDINSWM